MKRPETKIFSKGRPGRLNRVCKLCDSARHAANYVANRDAILVARKISTARWRKNNLKRVRKAERERMALRRLQNPQHVRRITRISVAKWRRVHPDRRRTLDSAKRAQRRGVPGSHTHEQIKALFKEQNGICAYSNINNRFCFRDLAKNGYTEDHKIPLVRKELNPTDDIGNIALACLVCNSSKGSKTVEEWMDGILAHFTNRRRVA